MYLILFLSTNHISFIRRSSDLSLLHIRSQYLLLARDIHKSTFCVVSNVKRLGGTLAEYDHDQPTLQP